MKAHQPFLMGSGNNIVGENSHSRESRPMAPIQEIWRHFQFGIASIPITTSQSSSSEGHHSIGYVVTDEVRQKSETWLTICLGGPKHTAYFSSQHKTQAANHCDRGGRVPTTSVGLYFLIKMLWTQVKNTPVSASF